MFISLSRSRPSTIIAAIVCPSLHRWHSHPVIKLQSVLDDVGVLASGGDGLAAEREGVSIELDDLEQKCSIGF